MKIKDGFILSEIAGGYHVIAVGSAVKEFNAIINLNASGAFLWKLLETGAKEEELITALTKEYEISAELAETDVKNFVNCLRGAKLITE